MTNKKKILLIDSNSLINRAFHALPPLQLPDGSFTNAIFGYLSMLQKLISEENPTHICAVFDCRAKTFRHLRYDGYKATRKPMPEELALQIPILKVMLQKMGIKILFKEGYEADDIIGTLGKRYNIDTIIVTGDRDCLQLVDDTTTVFWTKRGVSDVIKYTPESLLSLDGFTPSQIIEYKGLAGDSSDNIPGAPGVGAKTATDLLHSYKDIDGVYDHIDEIKGKLREKLLENKDQVYLSKELATICTTVDLPCELSEMTFDYPLKADAYAMMQKLQLKKLIDRFSFAGVEDVKSELKQVECNTISVSTKEELEKALILLEGEDISFIWDEIVQLSDGKNNICISISTDLFGVGLSEDEAIMLLSSVLKSNKNKVLFDVKQLKTILAAYGIDIEQPYDDLSLMAYLINPGRTVKNLSQLLEGYGFSGKNAAAEMIELKKVLIQRLQKDELLTLYRDLELPLIECLYSMEKIGFSIDIKVLNELDTLYSNEIQKLTTQIYQLAGEEFNINSNKQLASVLFDKMSLPHKKKNKTGYSVDADALEEIDHPIANALLKYRQMTKLKSTYIDGMRNVINQKTGKVHTYFKQNLTVTGRLSSTEPNLQNIPVRRAEGKEIRKMFVPSEGSVLVSADYSQIELRLLAHFSEDEKMIEAFCNGSDIHAITASKMFKVPLDQVSASMRSSAKAINFGIIYGISSFGLAKNASVTNSQAKQFMSEYFDTYPRVKVYMENNVKLAKEKGCLRTMLGRIRYFPELSSSQYAIRSFGERAAMNMPLQGSASDIIKMAMLRVWNALKGNGLSSNLILQVHDELILDVPKEEEAIVREILLNEMQNVVKLRVPLLVNISSGNNWYEAK
ncbi:MAG: DNA polymerase I [Clostridia bacterium]|nr:DNA polymerase I [Clostridia bacterium]